MIALYKGISGTSQVIKFLNWSDYSHASWVDDVDESNWEAWVRGVRHTPSVNADHAPGTPVDLFDDKLTPGEADGLREFFRSQLGKGYDYRGILHFVTRRPENPKDQDRWFCSEIIFAGFVVIGRPLLLRVPAWKVYPAMIGYSPLIAYQRTHIVRPAPYVTISQSTDEEVPCGIGV